MTKRNRIVEDHDETLLTDHTYNIFIPNVHVNYGGYSNEIDEVDDINDDNYYIDNIENVDMNNNLLE